MGLNLIEDRTIIDAKRRITDPERCQIQGSEARRQSEVSLFQCISTLFRNMQANTERHVQRHT